MITWDAEPVGSASGRAWPRWTWTAGAEVARAVVGATGTAAGVATAGWLAGVEVGGRELGRTDAADELGAGVETADPLIADGRAGIEEATATGLVGLAVGLDIAGAIAITTAAQRPTAAIAAEVASSRCTRM